ncbi:MAG: tetratricopeptide repeat protein, partial [Caldilineaceae bacterium]|nr:tetratricopeptide repeat protein [Caldilineaceae bacterium]
NTGSSATEQRGILRGDWESQIYILNEPIDTEVELSVEGFGKPQLSVYSLSGYFIDRSEPGEENLTSLSFTVEEAGPYVIEVTQPSQNENSFELTSSHPLARYIDPDDGRTIDVGETITASIDTTADVDYYELTLKKGDVVQITVDALEVDPELTLEYTSRALEVVVSDDDSGGGIFGSNAQLTYQAPADDTYRLVVRNYDYGNVGSYFLTVERAGTTAKLTEPTVNRELFSTGFGSMTWYESEAYDFAVLHPTLWTEVPGSRCAPGAIICYTGAGVIVITEDSLASLPKKERNRAGYLSLLQDNLKLNPAVELGPREEITTLQQLAADTLSFSAQAGRSHGERLIYVDEQQQVAFNVTIVFPAEVYPVFEPMIQLIFDSFRSWHDRDPATDAVYYLDQGSRLAANEDWPAALDAYTKSIALDPTLAVAYTRRAWLAYRLDDPDQALADIQQAIELAPEDARYYHDSSMLHWRLHDFEGALDAINQAIQLKSTQGSSYNQRALVQVFLGDYTAALADLETAQELNNDELPPSVLDTRGFIYLMMGDFAKAKKDYDETYRKDFRSPYTLLGGGIAYAKLGETEQAQALIEEGFKKLDELKVEQPDPQLSELITQAQALRAP